MNSIPPKITYRVGPNVGWVVETGGLLLSDGREEPHWLPYPQAAIWDLISQGYSTAKVCSMLMHIAALDSATAEPLLRESLEAWTQQGLLTKVGGTVNGDQSLDHQPL